MPPFDDVEAPGLDVLDVSTDGEWTSVTFARIGSGDDDSVSTLSERTLVLLSTDYTVSHDLMTGLAASRTRWSECRKGYECFHVCTI